MSRVNEDGFGGVAGYLFLGRLVEDIADQQPQEIGGVTRCKMCTQRCMYIYEKHEYTCIYIHTYVHDNFHLRQLIFSLTKRLPQASLVVLL